MQLLMAKSFEFGEHKGLGIIDGEVLNFEKKNELLEKGFKIPHVGWGKVRLCGDKQNLLLKMT